jgi:hypothetical protein
MKITKTLALGTLMAASLLVASACDDAKKDVKDGKTAAKADAKTVDVKAPEAKVDDAKAADAKADVAVEAKADGGAAPAGGEATKIGVAECDEYVSAMNQCFTSGGVPAEQRDAVKMGFDMSVQSWVDAMKTNPEGGTALVSGCKAALDMAKVSYPSCFAAK